MRTFLARYVLRNGTRGALDVLATCSCDAVVRVIDTFGDSLRSCSVRLTGAQQ